MVWTLLMLGLTIGIPKLEDSEVISDFLGITDDFENQLPAAWKKAIGHPPATASFAQLAEQEDVDVVASDLLGQAAASWPATQHDLQRKRFLEATGEAQEAEDAQQPYQVAAMTTSALLQLGEKAGGGAGAPPGTPVSKNVKDIIDAAAPFKNAAGYVFWVYGFYVVSPSESNLLIYVFGYLYESFNKYFGPGSWFDKSIDVYKRGTDNPPSAKPASFLEQEEELGASSSPISHKELLVDEQGNEGHENQMLQIEQLDHAPQRQSKSYYVDQVKDGNINLKFGKKMQTAAGINIASIVLLFIAVVCLMRLGCCSCGGPKKYGKGWCVTIVFWLAIACDLTLLILRGCIPGSVNDVLKPVQYSVEKSLGAVLEKVQDLDLSGTQCVSGFQWGLYRLIESASQGDPDAEADLKLFAGDQPGAVAQLKASRLASIAAAGPGATEEQVYALWTDPTAAAGRTQLPNFPIDDTTCKEVNQALKIDLPALYSDVVTPMILSPGPGATIAEILGYVTFSLTIVLLLVGMFCYGQLNPMAAAGKRR
ncbi:unnamed protein product [Amoebophrya sp. A120]|nr:unnamed protein product [Amoebophrya sp. A120]|eukprot:GSA120T00005773001.1